MSLSINTVFIERTKRPAFEDMRSEKRFRNVGDEIAVDAGKLAKEDLQELLEVLGDEDKKSARAIESILSAMDGRFDRQIPNFKAFQGVLLAYLKKDLIDGWIYKRKADGKLYAQLVVDVSYDGGNKGRGQKDDPTVFIRTIEYGHEPREEIRNFYAKHSFRPQDVTRRIVSDVLMSDGIFKETPALKAEYLESIERDKQLTRNGFAEQFRMNGLPLEYDGYHSGPLNSLENRPVIHDVEKKDFKAEVMSSDSILFEDDGGVGEIPENPCIKVFDLKTHEFFWTHFDNLTPFVYDKSLRDKLILPDTHRDLLDVLTSDISAFTEDMIEGKSAGNVILCQGPPGLGKTLSAEVFSQLMERPLYSIHSGNLGTNAEDIHKALEEVFSRGKRWNAVLLLDEADVFVVKRGMDIEQNAIVAEFLRTMEYFDGIMFMTSNRSGDIDDAILSRCAAIINYETPTRSDAFKIWRVMCAQYETDLGDELINELVELFDSISARDIKMLFRLSLRVANSKNEKLGIDTFRRCAMFRAIKMKAA